MESNMQPDLEEFLRLYDRLIICVRIIDGGLTEHECKAVLYFVIELEKIDRPYEDLDDLAAGIEITKFHSIGWLLERDTMAKVLVIDDEPNVRTIIDLLLREAGYDVLLANNGWKGLELYRREHPDVIVLDLKMPEVDGITVLKQIRGVDLKQPVIVLTADSDPATEQQVRAIGVHEFVMKSSSMHLLEDTLTHLFTGRKPKFG
jgi:CheY-like chemotaxis protein